MSKTAHAHQTSGRDKPCAQIHDRTENSGQQPALFEQYPDIHESSILDGDSCDSPSLQILSRTVDKHKEQVFFSALPTSNTNYTCTCEIVKIDHFATFPPKLIEPMILAGCPAQCCPTCGKGWERRVEKYSISDENGLENCEQTKQRELKRLGKTSAFLTGRHNESRTLGFRPICKCGAAESISGIILDPFGGSGTTAEVAVKHGRRVVLIELNADYIELSRQRILDAPIQPPLPLLVQTAARPEQMEMEL